MSHPNETIIASIEIKAEWQFTQKDIDYLLATAFEGGINYWCKIVEVKEWPEGASYASDVPSRGGTIFITEWETDDLGDPIVHAIGLREILSGIKHYCEYKNIHPYTLFDERQGDYDANDADMIVQFACFGEIVYG